LGYIKESWEKFELKANLLIIVHKKSRESSEIYNYFLYYDFKNIRRSQVINSNQELSRLFSIYYYHIADPSFIYTNYDNSISVGVNVQIPKFRRLGISRGLIHHLIENYISNYQYATAEAREFDGYKFADAIGMMPEKEFKGNKEEYKEYIGFNLIPPDRLNVKELDIDKILKVLEKNKKKLLK